MTDFRIPDVKPDPILELIGRYRADNRPDKIDLGVGVYRDDAGNTPVMAAVKAAESLLHTQQQSKSYLGLTGDAEFVEALGTLLFGHRAPHRFAGAQTPGGSGALRLAAELYNTVQPGGTLWIGVPTWPNHLPLTQSAGLRTQTYPYFDKHTQTVLFDSMLDHLSTATPGDAVLLHGCCHNPTGADLTPDQWQSLTTLLIERSLLPVIDLAYHGLGESLEDDLAATRLICSQLPQTMIAASASKNFGLYRDRTGAIYMAANDQSLATRAQSFFGQIARRMYSMPPDHGAALVRLILSDDQLKQRWCDELQTMTARVGTLRQQIATQSDRLRMDYVAQQKGMFSLLSLQPEQVDALIEDHAVYLPPDGRINIAGCKLAQVGKFIESLHAVGFGPPK